MLPKKRKENYCIGETIVCPEHKVRYVSSGEHGDHFMFHDDVIVNNELLKLTRCFTIVGTKRLEEFIRVNGDKKVVSEVINITGEQREIKRYRVISSFVPNYWTRSCDKMNKSGYCDGHVITREEFINTYCNGTEPLQYHTNATLIETFFRKYRKLRNVKDEEERRLPV